ncbi:hypothetical protein ACFYST_20770 [Kitasatospora sp. NPDC004614]|uniref:hypothetical protein n=1 Tax=unclassified Kitasatospora TaxID=2633591 RepID=UPI0036BFAA1D
MLLLGLLLFAASGAFAGLLIAENLGGGPETAVTMFGHQIATISTLGAFLAGIALTLIFGAGLLLIRAGLHRRHHYGHRHSQPAATTTTDSLGTGTIDPTTGTPSRGSHRYDH